MLSHVTINPEPVEKFRPVIGDEATDKLIEIGRTVAASLAGRTVWNVNSTAAGGGVAEMLQTLLSYQKSRTLPGRYFHFLLIVGLVHNSW